MDAGAAKEGEAAALLDLDRDDFPDHALRIAIEDDDFVVGRAAAEASGVGFGGTFAEDFLDGADERLVFLPGDAIDHVEQALVALLLDGFGQLAGHVRGGGVAAGGVAEDEGVVEADAFDGLEGGEEILFGFAREADDDVGGDGQARAGGLHALADFDEAGVFVGSAHFPQDAVRTALEREMDVGAELGQAGEGLDEVLAVADGVGGSEADAGDFVDFVDGIEQLDEGGFSGDAGEFGAAVEIDDLSQQGDLADAVSGQVADFGDDFGDGPLL